ncbi:unnamed protein product [Periconia digitata]|uniref:Uncharacterized protein n=1 Tax=Periconia digitata TaxID=1303443 RepID=A0A9W4XZ48_9PLEO|nr:unnamed protein product [Periconia digitata]
MAVLLFPHYGGAYSHTMAVLSSHIWRYFSSHTMAVLFHNLYTVVFLNIAVPLYTSRVPSFLVFSGIDFYIRQICHIFVAVLGAVEILCTFKLHWRLSTFFLPASANIVTLCSIAYG